VVNRKLLCCVAGSAVIITTLAALDSKEFKKHRGQVVDVDNKRPIGAKVSAWRLVQKSGSSDGCPIYGQALDVQAADSKTGNFVLQIPSDEGDYKTTTCLNDYYPRTDEPQSRDEDSVSPNPVKLLHRADGNAYRQAVRRELQEFISDLRYLRDSRSEDFQQLPSDEAFIQSFKSVYDRELARRFLMDLEMDSHIRK
jgi:hypothetical protein